MRPPTHRVNETGFATVPGKTEADQARWWIRVMATYAAERRIEHVGIYELKDLAPDRPAIGDLPNYHLGLTRTTGEKKTAFGTVRRLVAKFGVQRFARATDLLSVTPQRPEVRAEAFVRADGRQVVVAWTTGGATTVDLRVPFDASAVQKIGVDGTLGAPRRCAAGCCPGSHSMRARCGWFELSGAPAQGGRPQSLLRVCSDPNNLPCSDDKGAGFASARASSTCGSY